MPETGEHQRRRVHYRGRVQGVGFRYRVRRIADPFNVTGYVQNLPDGRVVLLAEGPSEELDRFFEAVRSQMGHYINDESQTAEPATGQFPQFDIRY